MLLCLCGPVGTKCSFRPTGDQLGPHNHNSEPPCRLGRASNGGCELQRLASLQPEFAALHLLLLSLIHLAASRQMMPILFATPEDRPKHSDGGLALADYPAGALICISSPHFDRHCRGHSSISIRRSLALAARRCSAHFGRGRPSATFEAARAAEFVVALR